MAPCIRFTRGWKYRLDERSFIPTGVTGHSAKTPWIELRTDGMLILEAGYCWDGPSGPALDTPSFMRGSAVHDAFYQLMRLGLLSQSIRKQADAEMRAICKEDGMWAVRRAYTWLAVRIGAASAADPANVERVECAPGNCGRCAREQDDRAVEVGA